MKQIYLSILFVFLSLNAFSGNVFLISVGISDYPGTANDLLLPAADARAVGNLYRTNNLASTRTLINSEATRENIIRSANSLFGKAGPDDIVVLFFSGHGIQGGFCAYDDFLLYDDVKAIFSNCRSKRKMIFADACFSGKLREPPSDRRRISQSDSDVMLFLSSRHNETSIERRGMQNGFFTTCLVRCLKGAADGNRDRRITAKELYESVSKGVIRLSNNRQHPVMWGHFSDDMVVMQW